MGFNTKKYTYLRRTRNGVEKTVVIRKVRRKKRRMKKC